MNDGEVRFEDYSYLTERQKQVFLLRSSGLSYIKIGQQLGISASAARTHYENGVRRVREKERYNAVQERNNEIADIDITRGELKLILQGLSLLEIKLEGNHRFKDSDWLGRLPYEHQLVTDLMAKARDYLYPETKTNERNDENGSSDYKKN